MTGFGHLNPKIPLVLAVLIFLSRIYFRVEHEKSFIISRHSFCVSASTRPAQLQTLA